MNIKRCWVESIEYENADKALREVYDKVRGPQGDLGNLYQAFSLRPHIIRPADELYLAAMHNPVNCLEKKHSELIGSHVAILSNCDYAYAHHSYNFIHLSTNRKRANQILEHLKKNEIEQCGNSREIAMLRYTQKLCLSPQHMTEEDVSILKRVKWDEGEVVEITQVASMFSYFVRMVNALGVSLDGEKIGLY